MDSQKSELEKSWEETPYQRAEWVPIKHSEYIPPQKDQSSNNNLTNDQVLQPRAEPVGNSHAKPLTRTDTGHSVSDEPAGKKANLPSNFTRT